MVDEVAMFWGSSPSNVRHTPFTIQNLDRLDRVLKKDCSLGPKNTGFSVKTCIILV